MGELAECLEAIYKASTEAIQMLNELKNEVEELKLKLLEYWEES